MSFYFELLPCIKKKSTPVPCKKLTTWHDGQIGYTSFHATVKRIQIRIKTDLLTIFTAAHKIIFL